MHNVYVESRNGKSMSTDNRARNASRLSDARDSGLEAGTKKRLPSINCDRQLDRDVNISPSRAAAPQQKKLCVCIGAAACDSCSTVGS